MIQIPFRVYTQILSLSRMNISQTSDHLANAINSGSNLRNLGQKTIHLPILELVNLGYTEKQITGIENNMLLYNIGQKVQHINSYFHTHPSFLQSVLINKYFSGDLSGIIAESVFVYYLILSLGISPYHIAHLRPYKKSTFVTPDFIILDQNMDISKAFSGVFGQLQYNGIVYAEVKGSMGYIEPERVKKALEQLSRGVAHSNQLGIVFVLNRPGINHYVATLVLVRG